MFSGLIFHLFSILWNCLSIKKIIVKRIILRSVAELLVSSYATAPLTQNIFFLHFQRFICLGTLPLKGHRHEIFHLRLYVILLLLVPKVMILRWLPTPPSEPYGKTGDEKGLPSPLSPRPACPGTQLGTEMVQLTPFSLSSPYMTSKYSQQCADSV
jgi:hypothetical protein